MKLDPRQRALAAIALGSLVVILLLGPFVVGSDARHLSAYAQGDEDASRFRAAIGQDVDALVGGPHALDALDDPTGALLVVLGVERRYDASETRAILDFVERGGNLLLVDESGYGSDVAHAAGFAFATQRVLDTRNHLGDPGLVDTQVRVGDQSYRVLFNQPTYLVALSDADPSRYTVLAQSSAAQFPQGSYVDTNEDGQIDVGDQPGPFPLAISTTLGRGALVLVSDTGPFMNRQMGVGEFQNEAFAAALVASLATAEGRILLDESRHAPPAALAPWNAALRTGVRVLEGDLAWAFVLVLLVGAGAAWRFTRATQDWSRHDFDVGRELPLHETIRPDAHRAQRVARRRISEKYNIPMEQVQAMTAEELVAATGDRTLAEFASGTSKADPASVFSTLTPTEASQ